MSAVPDFSEYRLEGAADVWAGWRARLTLIKHLTRRHLAERYRGSALGFVWSLLNPLLMMLVYSFVFRVVMRAQIPGVRYEAFFLTGYLAWNFFSVGAQNAASSVVEGRYLIHKARLPHVALPLAAILSNLVNYVVVLPLLLIFNAIFGVRLGPSILLLPLAVLLLSALTVGVGLILAGAAPFFRDLLQVSGVLFTAWFFATPILYHLQYQLAPHVSPAMLLLYEMNPTVGATRFIQAVFLNEAMPWREIAYSFLGAIAFLAIGILSFGRLSKRFFEAL
ncbi:MAG: ABC transporter permease [Candidatus Sumerlaeota bacterium]|nr:ABC transporter permease [Candidatus Sumerlaeota bacterium]